MVGVVGEQISAAAAGSAAAGGDGLAGHVAERVVGVRAEGGDGGDADHDDQGQHHGVFDGRRAVFTLQEVHELFRQGAHVSSPGRMAIIAVSVVYVVYVASALVVAVDTSRTIL